MRAPSPVTLGNLRLNVAVLMTAAWRHMRHELLPSHSCPFLNKSDARHSAASSQ